MKALPKNARQVFKGVIFEVWQWQQKVYDGTEKTFEILKRPDTAQVIAIVNDKILILDQEQPHQNNAFPSLPGGRCGEAEEPLASVKRELLEETGYKSDSWSLWQEQAPIGKMIWNIYTFIAKDCYRVQEPSPDEGERIKPRFITFDELLDLAENPLFREKELQGILVKAKYNSEAKGDLKKELFD